MARVLILFVHPALEKSRIHRQLIRAVPALPNLTFHDLYEAYPDFDIDVDHEQELLLAHDLILFQFPFYWYSTPPLVKQWEDLVLEHGWAYGSTGTMLQGKRLCCLITTGGGAAAYQHEGYNRYTIREFLAPLEQTAQLCRMEFLPPYLIQGTHRLEAGDIEVAASRYRQLLHWLHDDQIDWGIAGRYPTLNEALLHLQLA
jgi:glutathione-regulated potassium-efflux system ancillary protein KefG